MKARTRDLRPGLHYAVPTGLCINLRGRERMHPFLPKTFLAITNRYGIFLKVRGLHTQSRCVGL